MKKDQSVFVVTIGFILIAAVTGLILLRSGAKEKQVAIEKTETVPENIASKKGIESSELFKMMLGNNNFILLDIRSSEEFAKEHIQNSKNIPASSLSAAISSMEKNKTYVIISSGLSSEELGSLSDIFQKNGIEKYFYLTGGIVAWKKAYNPTVSEGDPTLFTDQAKVTYIKSDDLKKLINSDQNLFIIDLRKSGQFNEGHLKNATNIFLDNLESESGKILPGRKIVLYDNDGLWAFKGAVKLYDLGFFGVLALSDGLDAWKKKGFEIVK